MEAATPSLPAVISGLTLVREHRVRRPSAATQHTFLRPLDAQCAEASVQDMSAEFPSSPHQPFHTVLRRATVDCNPLPTADLNHEAGARSYLFLCLNNCGFVRLFVYGRRKILAEILFFNGSPPVYLQQHDVCSVIKKLGKDVFSDTRSYDVLKIGDEDKFTGTQSGSDRKTSLNSFSAASSMH
ncbi:hypothetical protein F2P81_015801 [Scophthalmus maximus]|uniref:Uncharacterized protein n=1 Tax=Scophthalmus maximus TaxID=52904 RepID=A0A6A4S7R4_SCOMX|nr:hypothetical protein F2P81_015801 [Scophthalmus maximus]